MERSGTADTRNGAPPAANPRDMVFDSLWPHFCFDCVVPHLHSFFSSPYIPLCPLSLAFPLCILCQPCTCCCDSLSALHMPLCSYTVSPLRRRGCSWDAGPSAGPHLTICHTAEGCTVIWKDIQRNGWKLWQLQSFLWGVLWWSWNMQLVEGCGVRGTKWVTYLLSGTCDERPSGRDSCTAKSQALFYMHVTRAWQRFQEQDIPVSLVQRDK